MNPGKFYTVLMQLQRSLSLWLILCAGVVWAQQAPPYIPASRTPNAAQVSQPSQGDTFAPDAAAQQSLDNAFQQAQQTQRRVLVIYGGSWCAHCAGLLTAMESSADAAQTLRDGYVSVVLNIEKLPGLQQFAQHLDPDLKVTSETGPLITILDKSGKLIESRTAVRLLDNGTIAAPKVAKFLNRFAPLAPANEVYQKGLAQLRGSGKLGWVEFGADWCVWCHHMDEFFDQSAAAPILQSYYVRIPIDYERNDGAPALAKQLGAPAGDGLPLWAVVDAEGKPLANSNTPKGNIGFPGTPEEIAEFVAVVQSTAKGIAPAQLLVIQKTLQAKPAQ
ncbi:MAG: thioredoxin family protein [Candidatus Korobacteraceae bacterium]